MTTEEIEPGEWASFGASFTDRHRGWLVRATRWTPGGCERRIFDRVALEHLEIDTRADPPRLLCVAQGTDACTLVSLVSDAPRRVLALHADGGDLGLRVETADGGATELRFRVPARPEHVDA